jgi:hypothetical protein
MRVNELISSFQIWITNEERELLKKFDRPIKVSSLSEHEQFRVQALVRKDLLTKSGFKDPTVVINEKFR